MGESQSWLFEPTFNRSVKVESQDERITTDGGAILLREADHQLGLTEYLASELFDPRRQDRIRYTLTELLRERLFAMALGYSVQDDADRLAHDPAFKMAVWDRRGDDVIDERLASQPTQSRLISILAQEDNREKFRDGLFESISRYILSAGPNRRAFHATIDVDSFPVVVHGSQSGAAYNGHYQATIYHPLVASICIDGKFDATRPGSRLGNGFIGAQLRIGNAYTTDGSLPFIQTLVERARQVSRYFDFRLDAGFVTGEIMDLLTDDKVRFLGRIKANPRLHALAEPHLTRPPGRPPKDGYHRVIELGKYQADEWKHSQRLILVIVDEPDSDGLLFDMPRYFFLLTNYPRSTRSGWDILQHYRQRGTFEDRLSEFNNVLGPHLSQDDCWKNDVTMIMALLAFNLSSFLRLELEAAHQGSWDLSRFRDCVLKAGGRIVKRANRLIVKLARAVSNFWSTLSARISHWRLPTTYPTRNGPQPRRWMPPPAHAHLELVHRE
jgi:hypothetical protein